MKVGHLVVPDKVSHLKFLENDAKILATAGSQVYLFDLEKPAPVFQQWKSDALMCFLAPLEFPHKLNCSDSAENAVVSGSNNGDLVLWHLGTGDLAQHKHLYGENKTEKLS